MDRHILQARANYCIPACIVMVEAWNGTLSTPSDVRQDQLFDALNINGLCSLDAAATILPNEGYGEPDMDDADMFRELAKIVRSGRRVIVTCWPGPLGRIIGGKGARSSPHGSLPDSNFPLHALYVFDSSGESFAVFDPWHTEDEQPLRLTWDELALIWNRMMLVATR